MLHEIKIQKEFAQAVYLGEKTFEVRNNDRGYQKGDLIVFKVMDGVFRDLTHPLNDMAFEITYVLGSFVGLAPNHVAFAIRRVTGEMEVAKDPKHGKWIETGADDPCHYFCSECKRQVDIRENFCPSCGAIMEETE